MVFWCPFHVVHVPGPVGRGVLLCGPCPQLAEFRHELEADLDVTRTPHWSMMSTSQFEGTRAV
ncbi:MAG: hypothetical protein OXI29_15095 [bacterium]|nr:hypothetical protein [bacterium]MDE0615133.1 hypothetical protein [bacterium]